MGLLLTTVARVQLRLMFNLIHVVSTSTTKWSTQECYPREYYSSSITSSRVVLIEYYLNGYYSKIDTFASICVTGSPRQEGLPATTCAFFTFSLVLLFVSKKLITRTIFIVGKACDAADEGDCITWRM